MQVDLLLFYTPLGMGQLGESWSSWSFLQAAGCAALLLTLTYDASLRITSSTASWAC